MPDYSQVDALINAGRYQEAWNAAAAQGVGAADIANHVNGTYGTSWTPQQLISSYGGDSNISNIPYYAYNPAPAPAPTPTAPPPTASQPAVSGGAAYDKLLAEYNKQAASGGGSAPYKVTIDGVDYAVTGGRGDGAGPIAFVANAGNGYGMTYDTSDKGGYLTKDTSNALTGFVLPAAGLLLGANALNGGGMFSGAATGAGGTVSAEAAAQAAFQAAGGVAGGANAVAASQAAFAAAGGIGALSAAEIAAMTTAGQFAPYVPEFVAGTTGALGAGAGTAGALGAGAGAGTAAGGAFGLTAGQAALLGTGLNLAGGVIGAGAAKDAAQTTADAQLKAAQIAADAAKFKPVGVTTRFGQSNFGYDANGNLTSAGYTLAPDLKAQQDQLMGTSNQMLSQFTGSQAATAPMGQAAQSAMALGNQYLTTSPQAQAQKYMAEQQALLATGRERDYAALQQRLASQGRLGLATGATSNGMMAANPELEAWNNAKRQQDLELAAKATQGGMDYATFGAGMVGTGGDLLKSMYGTQTAAYAPYQTALGGAQTLEGLGQGAMDIGTSIGAKVSTANANAGNATAQGMLNAANTMAPANAYSPWGSLLSGAGTAINQYNTQQQQQNYMFNPYTGVKL